MSRKTIIILAAVTAVVLVAAWLAVDMRESATERQIAGEVLFPDLIDAANDVAAVRVNGSEGAFTLELGDDGWVVSEKDGYPATFESIKPVILAIAEAKTISAKTADPARFEALGLDDPSEDPRSATQVTLVDGAGADVASLLLGERGLGGGAKRYVRRAGEDQTWLADIDIDVPERPLDWVDKTLASLGADALWRATVNPPDGTAVTVAKVDQTSGRVRLETVPEGMKPKSQGVLAGIANVLSRLDMTNVRRAGPDDLDPAATVTSVYETFDGLVVTARSVDLDDAVWITLEARFDQAAATEAGAVPYEVDPDGNPIEAMADPNAPEDESGEGEDVPSPAEQAQQDADRLNAIWSGWLYAVADFRAEQIRADADAVLEPVAVESEEPAPETLDPETLQGFEELLEDGTPGE